MKSLDVHLREHGDFVYADVECEKAEDEKLLHKLNERCLSHVVSYTAEAAMHFYLGNDPDLIYRFNDLNIYGQPDGYLKDGSAYDVYCRQKNRWGLSKRPKDDIQIYVLSHWFAGLVWLVGYATLTELKRNGARERYDRLSLRINQLHPVRFLTSDWRLSLEVFVAMEDLYELQDAVEERGF